MPRPYTPPPRGNLGVTFLDYADEECRARGLTTPPNSTIVACHVRSVIIMPNPCKWGTRSDYADLMCHEMAHRNGWSHGAAR